MFVVHHLPACPFAQRLQILLELKGRRDQVEFKAVDITQPRAPELLVLRGGTNALPVLELSDGTVLGDSLVILRYLDASLVHHPVAQVDPLRHAVENMLVSHERDFGEAGFRMLMNREPHRREALHERLLMQYARLDEVLRRFDSPGAHGMAGATAPWLWQHFGWAEAVFTPLFMRFWCLGYYEDFELPDDARFARVRAWEQACIAHPAAQQVTREEVVKLYFDYALGVDNGALAQGRTRSSLAPLPHWSTRPWPPRDKYGAAVSDLALGLA